MGFVSRIFYFFAPYTDASERAVGLFFKGLTEHSSPAKTRDKLHRLLQRDIAVINLWTEYRYKGYKYLKKRERRKLYANLQSISNDFERYRAANPVTGDSVIAHIHQIVPHANISSERAALFQSLMDYFATTYDYRESSSFGRLLRNPSHERLIGDCNQIVTLYVYLYSRYFAISDLHIRLLPGHVALHHSGVDIEATNGTFANYQGREGAKVLPIEEIVSVNLLDVTDSYLKTHEVAAQDFLQASRFAFILSHDRAIVTHNLEAAYGALINSLMKRNNYQQALTFARASRDMELIGIVGHNGAVYEIQRHRYTAARKFAAYAPRRTELVKNSYHAEGTYHFNAHRYHDAIKAFEKHGDKALIQQCYEALFFAEQQKLPSSMTVTDMKNHAATIKRMRVYAKKSGNKQLIAHINNFHE